MSLSILEYFRTLHTDIERAQIELQDQIVHPASDSRHGVLQQHYIKERVQTIQNTSSVLRDMYESSDERSAVLSADKDPKVVLTGFYQRMQEIREYHRKHSTQDVAIEEPTEALTVRFASKVPFTGEENWGRCVDCVELHKSFVALTKDETLRYRAYIAGPLTDLSLIPESVKVEKDFQLYLKKLCLYFADLYKRVSPLDDATPKEQPLALEQCVAFWANVHDERIKNTLNRLDRKATATWEELEAEERREDERMHAALAATNCSSSAANTTTNEHPDQSKFAPSAALDKQPRGWDGNPIPTWLSKLHGLTVPFHCAICQMTYYGPQVYDRHFQEARHTHYLSRLGIQYTRHFHGVSEAAEAKALYQRLCRESGKGMWRRDEEEFEDGDGNVLSKRTLETMKRQKLQ
eukprot:PhM_4_TR495/c0_g1_i1/m.84558/K12827/SF3A3, SAP61, PRP9; splicing factor 3A subunit 3